MGLKQVLVFRVSQPLEKPGGPFHVREKEGDRADRQLPVFHGMGCYVPVDQPAGARCTRAE